MGWRLGGLGRDNQVRGTEIKRRRLVLMSETRPTFGGLCTRAFTGFANQTSRLAGRPLTFAICIALIVVWALTGPIFGFSDTWQLIINTVTTIITFLMVALLQNSQTRSDKAVQHKLNAIADGLADLMEHVSRDDASFEQEIHELKLAVGLERHESTSSARPS